MKLYTKPCVEVPYTDLYRRLSSYILHGSTNDLKGLEEKQRYSVSWIAAYNHLLLALAKGKPFKFPKDIPLQNRIRRVKTLESETHHIVRYLIPKFEKSNLPVFAIKSFLPFAYADRNLDLVTIYPEKMNSYVNKLYQLGYRKFRNLGDLREPGKSSYFKKNLDLMIHLHNAITWNGLEYLPLDQIIERKRTISIEGHAVAIPSDEDELLIMAAHACFENKYMSLHEVLYWHHLVNSDLNWGYMVKTAEELNWLNGFVAFQSIASMLSRFLGLKVTLPIQLISLPLIKNVWFPYVLPVKQSFAVTGSKLRQDIIAKKWRQLPRELFSYTIVDGLWMYRKAYRKRLKVKGICS